MIGPFKRAAASTDAPKWDKIDPVQEAIELAKIAKFAADCVGVFSLFALVVVFSDIAGAKHLTWSLDAIGPYAGLGASLHIPWLPFLLAGALGVWIFNRHGLRILLTLRFASPEQRRWLGLAWGGRDATPIAKTAVALALVAFSALIIVTATKFQDGGRMEDARQAAIVEETAARDRAAVQAELDSVTRDLRTLTQPDDSTPNFQTQAARAGATSWAARVRATSDPTLQQRLGAEQPTAERADTLRERETALRRELASAPVTAAVARQVAVDRGATDWIIGAFASIPLWFAVATEFLALIMKLVEVLLLRRAQAAWLAAQDAQTASAETATSPDPAPVQGEPETPPEAPAAAAPEVTPGGTSTLTPDPAPETQPEPVRKRPLKALPEPTAEEMAAWRGLADAPPAVDAGDDDDMAKQADDQRSAA